MALLHIDHDTHGAFADFLHDNLGAFGAFLDEVVLHSLLDVLNLLPFLFLTLKCFCNLRENQPVSDLY